MSDTHLHPPDARHPLSETGPGPRRLAVRRTVLVSACAVVAVAVVIGIAAMRPLGRGSVSSPAASPSPSPETTLALSIARSAARGAQVTQAAYIVAVPKAVESVLHPGEDNLQRLIPAGHQMLVIELAGKFDNELAMMSPPKQPLGQASPPPFTSMTVFCDASTGQCVSMALAGGPTPDVIADLARFGQPVPLAHL